MSKWRVVHEHESDSGLTRISSNDNGDVKIDSYMGNPRDRDNHDRLTVDTEKDTMYYHGFYHERDNRYNNDNENENDDGIRKYRY